MIKFMCTSITSCTPAVQRALKQMGVATLLLVLAAQWLSAATATERDAQFWTIKHLVDKELRLVADPEMKAFQAQDYPDGANYANILRFYYCQVFQLDDADLAKEMPALTKVITKTGVAQVDALSNTEVSNGAVLRYVNPILRDLMPDSPAHKLSDDKKERVDKRIALLIDNATKILGEFKSRIDEHAADETKYEHGELAGNDEQKVLQKAVALRLDYANEFYYSYLALREVLYRGEQFGLDASSSNAFMESLLGTDEQVEKVGAWDWNYGDYQIFLRHRLQVMLSDAVRRGKNHTSYAQVVSGFQDVLDTPLDGYPGSVKPLVAKLKLTALSDLLYWHVAMQHERENLLAQDKAEEEAAAADAKARNKKRKAKNKFHRRGVTVTRPDYALEGVKLFEHYQEEMKLSDELRKDKDLTNQVAQVYFVAGRLYRLSNQVPKALELITEIMDIRPKHYYYGNARRWKSFFVKPPDVDIDFYTPMTLVDPAKVLDSIADILAEARSTEDEKQRNRMYVGAAVSLRNAVLSLQDDQYRRNWFSLGPKTYYQYAYVLYKLGKYEDAAIVSMEGALAYKEYYERRRHNPFKDDSGKANANMEGLQKLVQNLSPYTAQLRRVDPSEATAAMYRNSLKLLDVYKDIVAAPNPKSLVIIDIQEDNTKAAIEKLEVFASAKDLSPADQIWAARIRAYAYYLIWDDAFKTNDESQTKAAGDKLTAAIKTVDEVMAKLKDAKDVAEEAVKARQMITSIEVGKAFRTEDYLKVLTTLDDDFWSNPPEEGSVLQKLAGQMCGASYRYHILLVKEKDPQKTIAVWPHIKRAYMALKLAQEKTGANLANSSKALAETYKNLGKLADWFIANKDTANAKSFDYAEMTKIAQQAPLQYGNLMMPIVSGDTSNLPLLAVVARTLQRGGDDKRAAVLYGQYLQAVATDSEMKTFKDDPKGVVDKVGDVVITAPLSSIRKSWVEIRDLLVDKAGFVEGEYRQYGGTTKKLSEEKVNYAEAGDQLDKMLENANASKAALGRDYDKFVAAVTGLRDLAKKIAAYYQVMDFAVQAYLANGEMESALPYIHALIAFDPIHPRYRALNVEIVLRAIKTDNPPTKEAIKDARNITTDLVKQYLNKPDKVRDYWLAYCQAVELTAVLGEIDAVNTSLRRHAHSDITPILFDLAIANKDGTYTAKDAEAAGLIKRYLAIYNTKGVTYAKPFTLSTNDDQLIIKMVKE